MMLRLQYVLFITSTVLLLTVLVGGQEDSEEIFSDFETYRGETGPIVWGNLRGRGGWGGWNAWEGWLPGGSEYKKGLKRSKKKWKRRKKWIFQKNQRPYLSDLHAYHIPGPYGWGWNGAGSDWFEHGDDYWK